MSNVVQRAQRDLNQGRLWKARDRLQGALRGRPQDQEILRLLGEICFRMGDLPAAGACWYLTERSGPEVEGSNRALHSRFGSGASGLINALPFHPRYLRDASFTSSFPPFVQGRFEQLREEATRLRPRWGERHYDGTHRQDNVLVKKTWFDRRVVPVLAGGVMVAIIGIWLLGLVALFYLIFYGL